jgi:hypothetical protein
MIRCGLLEQHDATVAYFRGGLNREIQDIHDCKEYADMTTLFEHPCKAECEVQERSSKTYSNSFAGRSSTSSLAPALPAPSKPTTTALKSPAPSTPTTTPLERTAEPTGASSFVNSEPSLHNAPNTPTENIGNAHATTLTKGENCVNVLNFSTKHALIDHLIVELSLRLSLSHGSLLDVSCDELFATTSVLHDSAKKNHVMHVASKKMMRYKCHLLYIHLVTLNLIIYVI